MLLLALVGVAIVTIAAVVWYGMLEWAKRSKDPYPRHVHAEKPSRIDDHKDPTVYYI
jgi:hypothetical protein